MAAFTTTQAGSVSTGGTFVGGVAPNPLGGDTITANHNLTFDIDFILGTSPSDQSTIVLSVASGKTVTVASGKQLTLRGNANSGDNAGGGPIFQAGSILEFDAHLAGTPATTYKWDLMRGFTGPGTFTANGTSGSHVTIRSNAGGGNGWFAGGNGQVKLDLTYCDFQSIGDSTNRCLSLGGGPGSITDGMSHVTFDANCGVVKYTRDCPVSSGFDFADCQFNQTNAAVGGASHKNVLILATNNSAFTGTSRNLTRCWFEKEPHLANPGLIMTDCLFNHVWDNNVGGTTLKWAGMTGCFVLGLDSAGRQHGGDLTDCFVLFDSRAAASVTGTSSGSNTTSTLNDTGKSWTVNQFQPSGSSVFYYVEITGGTGVGQRRGIWTNTATALTITYRWDTTPDATSTYAIVADIANNHGLLPQSNVTSGTFTLDGVIWQSAGCDTQGDCWLHLDANGVTHTQIRNIVLPNAMGDSTGTLVTLFDVDAGSYLAYHNTCFTGAEAALSLREPSTSGTGAGQVDACKSNVFWCDPNRAITPPNSSNHTQYWNNGGAYGPYAAVDTSNPNNPLSGTSDLIVAGAITNNCGYGVLVGQGKGFQLNMSVAPDATNLLGTDPQFVDSTRTFWGWAVSRGSVATTITGQITDGLSYLKADPTLTRTSLLPYIRAGFAPRNSLLKNAGHDSVTIGAVEGLFHNQLTLTGVG